MLAISKPQINEVAGALQDHLAKCFKNAACRVIECPDLSANPFNLSLSGLGGNPAVCDVGSFDYLLPRANQSKTYDLLDVFKRGNATHGTVIGAGAGPFHKTGINSEMVINMSVTDGKPSQNGSYYGSFDEKGNTYLSTKATTSDFALLGQMFMCEGKSGPVIEIVASDRTKNAKFDAILREALTVKYGSLSLPVGLGGVILQDKGKSMFHVIPKFVSEPLDTPDKVKNWLKFYEVSSPVVSVGTVVSHDPTKLGLRLEHFHCFNQDRTACGHCHFDKDGAQASYRAYLSLADHLIRIDQPK